MQILPTVWAGTLSAVLSVAAIILIIIFLSARNRNLQLGLGVAASLVSLVVLSAGIDSILVHGERSILVFASVGIAAVILIFLLFKLLFRKANTNRSA